MTDPSCSGCAACEARLELALGERDEALLALARAREELDRLRLAERWQGEPDVPAYPLGAGAAWPVPLRYRLVDAAHGWVKGGLGRVRALARRGKA